MFSSSKGRKTKKSNIAKGTTDPTPRAGRRKSQKFKNLTMFSNSKGWTMKKSKIQKSNLVLQLQGQEDEKVKIQKYKSRLPKILNN